MRELPKCLQNISEFNSEEYDDINDLLEAIEDEEIKNEIGVLISFCNKNFAVPITLSCLLDREELSSPLECAKYLFQHISKDDLFILLLTTEVINGNDEATDFVKQMSEVLSD